MKKPLRHIVLAAVGAAFALASSSCTYDPYYSSSSSSYGGSYGQGYGGSSFSTSLFVGTGDSRWGYDPSCRSYYDYRRRCYYDPYLHGYYPVGYRPQYVYGTPHPYGYSASRRYCAPPRQVTTITLSNYRDRESSYRNSNYGWASQLRSQPSRSTYSSYSSRDYSRDSYRGRPDSGFNPFSRSTPPSNYDQHSGRSFGSGREQRRQEFRPSNTSVSQFQRPERRERPEPSFQPQASPTPQPEFRPRPSSAPEAQRTEGKSERMQEMKDAAEQKFGKFQR